MASRWNPRLRTTLHGRLDWGWLRQDQSFLPYTSNAAIAVEPLPATSLDGRSNTFSGTLNLVSRLTGEAASRHRASTQGTGERHPGAVSDPGAWRPLRNRAPREPHPCVRPHQDGVAVAVPADPSRAARGGCAGAARQPGGGRDRAERRAGALAGGARDEPTGFRLSARFAKADRDASALRDVTANNPLTRRFHQAARRQRAWRAKIDYLLGLGRAFRGPPSRPPLEPLSEFAPWDCAVTTTPGAGARTSRTPNATFTLSGFRTAREAGSRTGRKPRLRRGGLVVRHPRHRAHHRARVARPRIGQRPRGRVVDVRPFARPRALRHPRAGRAIGVSGACIRASLRGHPGTLPLERADDAHHPLLS